MRINAIKQRMGDKICHPFRKPFFYWKVVVLGFLLMITFDESGQAKQNRQVTKISFSDELPARQLISLNLGWRFHYLYDVRKIFQQQQVDIPHTWNNRPGPDTLNYNRTAAIYERSLSLKKEWRGKRFFLYFEGVNSSCSVFVNNKYVDSHTGGYTAFCFEITAFVNFEAENIITVQVSNAFSYGALPVAGDFNIYGGIHRPVSLLITPQNCISPLDFASPGVYVDPISVSEKVAKIGIKTVLSFAQPNSKLQLMTQIIDAKNRIIKENILPVSADTTLNDMLTVSQPHLWNGVKDPYRYKVTVSILAGTRLIDSVSVYTGLRYFKVDPQKGLLLNGHYLNIRGVCRHEDVFGKGSALGDTDQERDIALIRELGANGVRLTHYPQSRLFYDLCDRYGLVVWSEIPLVGPGGYRGAGFVNSPVLKKQARQVLAEMIKQNYNHPAVLFWGLYNELKLDYDDPRNFIKELDQLTKQLDPGRLTAGATFLDGAAFNGLTDLIGWNKYYGWYGGDAKDLGVWADQTHSLYPQQAFALSEYGAGGSAFKHESEGLHPLPDSRFHPEEGQTAFHEKSWHDLAKRPFIWGKFIWVLADLGSSIRNEGDQPGINDKGLVTYDRAIKKDAFYFYKANWNDEPMLHLTERRFAERKDSVISVKAYTNFPVAELYVNGKSQGTLQKDSLCRLIWPAVRLKSGLNHIKIIAQKGNLRLVDSCYWRRLITGRNDSVMPTLLRHSE